MLIEIEQENTLSNRLLFVIMPCNGGAGDSVMNFFKIPSLPAVLYVRTNQGMK